MKRLAQNRRATFDIAVEHRYEAGLRLTSDEIKSIRSDRAQLTGAYIRLMRARKGMPEPMLIGSHFALAKDPDRSRPLLMNAKEIRELDEFLSEKGMTAVPLAIHFKRGWAKIEVGVGKGRKNYDKRELLKKRDLDRQERASLKRG